MFIISYLFPLVKGAIRMATAKKLPSGNWRVNLYIGLNPDGKRIYKSFTAPTKKEAEFMAVAYNIKRKEKARNITVGDAIDGYIESKKNILSPTTIAEYQQTRRNKLQRLMSIQLSKLTNIDIQQAINEDAKRLAPKSIRNAHGLLSAALKMYLPDFILRTTLPKKQPKIKDLPTPEEVLQAVRGTDIELPVLLALWLGMRLSEVIGLRFSDISEDGIITISHVRVAVDGKIVEKSTTKTYESTRRIQAPSEIITMIQNVPHQSDEEYVVKVYRGCIYKKFKRIVAENGLKNMTFHDLRHLNASVMLALGVPDKYAMERGGWSSNNVLKSVYQHTFSTERKQVDDRIDRYFRDAFEKTTSK